MTPISPLRARRGRLPRREPAGIVGEVSLEGAMGLDPPRRWDGKLRLWYDLVWSEWFAHSRLLFCFLLGWLALVWLLPLVTHPLWILVLGLAFALVAGPAFGGADVINGCEEFMLGLPPQRSERFMARLLVGGGALVLLTGMNLLALGLNLSDVLDRVFLNTGLIQAVQLRQPRMLYGLVVVVPLAVFSCGFAMATLSRSRTVAFTSWLWGSLVALGVLRLGLFWEEGSNDRLDGRYSVPLLLAASVVVLAVAWRLYIRKEAGADASPLRIPPGWWGWIIALLAAGLGVGILLSWFATNFSRLL